MTSLVLTRQPLGFADADVLANEVASRASNELSYRPAEMQSRERRDKIAAAFAACKLQPFTNSRVELYMGLKVLRAVLPYAMLLLSALGWIGMHQYHWYATTKFVDPATNDPGPAFMFLLVTGAMLALWIIPTVMLLNRIPLWRYTQLSSYSKKVPEFALLTALTLKAELQKQGFSWSTFGFSVAEFIPMRVRHLEIAHEKERARIALRNADPFLVVRIDDKDYFLEVWDEPGFNRKRTA